MLVVVLTVLATGPLKMMVPTVASGWLNLSSRVS